MELIELLGVLLIAGGALAIYWPVAPIVLGSYLVWVAQQ